MTDRPMLFSAPMVQALLKGTKQQTRRIINPQPRIDARVNPNFSQLEAVRETTGRYRIYGSEPASDFFKVRFSVGDRLWVKEVWQAGSTGVGPAVAYRANYDRWYPTFTGASEGAGPTFDYDAHPTTAWEKGLWIPDVEAHGPWQSPLHMPRWASRLTLTIVNVQVQRLHHISGFDARAEGYPDLLLDSDILHFGGGKRARQWYRDLWERINGAGSWEKNPWVAALTFTVERGNIDAASRASA